MPLRTGSARRNPFVSVVTPGRLAQPVPPSSVRLVAANHVSRTFVAAGHALGVTLRTHTCTTDILVRRSFVEQLARPNTFCARTMWK